MTSRAFGPGRIELVRGDITRERVDAIVNAANSSLMGGGGVDGAIHRAGGAAILEDCRRIRAERGPLPPGEAVITTGGRPPCRHVIHTVGPVWHGGDSAGAETLARCYANSLALAEAHGLSSVTFPSISTGVFGYPVEQAAVIALAAVRDALQKKPRNVTLVRLVLFSDSDLAAYATALETI